MSAAKRDALIDLLPAWSLPNPLTTPLTEAALTAAFGRSAPRLLDIGVGTGEATLAWATDHPDHDVVAVELHRPGIARMLQELDADGPPNVRIVETDVVRLFDVLTGVLTATDEGPLFDGVRVLFPDPWPKARHLSRRLVDQRFLATVADLLPPGGWLHLATDWDGYALQMARALAAEPRFEVDADPDALAEILDPGYDPPAGEDPLSWSSPRPPRPVTTYERRGIRAGRRVTDLLARRR